MFARSLRSVTARWLGVALLIAPISATARAQTFFSSTLVTNVCCDPVARFDRNLRSAWGVAIGAAGPAWVVAGFSGRSSLYDGFGTIQPLSVGMEPAPLFANSSPSGIVSNPGAAFQTIDDNGDTGPARFLFATLEGTLTAWKPAAAGRPQNTHAHIVVDRSAQGGPGAAHYTGISLTTGALGDVVYAADFKNGRIDSFGANLALLAPAFNDPSLPLGYAPFNVYVFLNKVFVAYAVPDQFHTKAMPASGSGIVDVFSLDGVFQSRLVTGGPLNAPWGMAVAPAGFGTLSGALLVANSGDGRINAFDAEGNHLATLADATGPIAIDGLMGLAFGNGSQNQPTSTLFYTASPSFAVVGEFGRIDAAAIVVPPICHADYNRDGRIAVQDIFDFLNSWFAADLAADFNHSNTLETQDIFDFLNSWLGGCD
jgi:uncharacterized protein (TIGR03118 family)